MGEILSFPLADCYNYMGMIVMVEPQTQASCNSSSKTFHSYAPFMYIIQWSSVQRQQVRGLVDEEVHR